MMKKLLVFCMLAILILSCLAGCGMKSKNTYGYGDSSDGVKMSGAWNFAENEISSESVTQNEAKVFKTDAKLTDYSLTMNIKSVEKSETDKSTFGAYAYYKDSSNYVEMLVDGGELDVETVKGYDVQTVTASLPKAASFTDYVKFEIVKIGDEIRFYCMDKLITTVMESFAGEGQYALLSNYAKVSFKDILTADATVFASKEILAETFTPTKDTVGEWSINGGDVERTDNDVATANIESVVFNSAISNDYKFTAYAKQTEVIENGYGFYGVVGYYQNATNYVIVFFKDIYYDVLVMSNGDYNWTGGAEIPNVDEETKNHKVEFLKIDDTMRIFINDTYERELVYTMFTRPGSVGFDTNGASAKFKAQTLTEISSFDDDRYQKDGMLLINYPHLIEYESGKYTTVDAAMADGTNYGGSVITQSYTTGNSYTYNVDVYTANLGGVGNFTGVVGACFGTPYVVLLIDNNGNWDLYGNYTTKDEVSVVNTFAGVGGKLSDAAFEGGVLKEKLSFKVVKTDGEIKFFVENEEITAINIPTLKYSRPGLFANFVGASFEVK